MPCGMNILQKADSLGHNSCGYLISNQDSAKPWSDRFVLFISVLVAALKLNVVVRPKVYYYVMVIMSSVYPIELA